MSELGYGFDYGWTVVPFFFSVRPTADVICQLGIDGDDEGRFVEHLRTTTVHAVANKHAYRMLSTLSVSHMSITCLGLA